MAAPLKPKLRALEFIPVEVNGKGYLYVKDPLGVVPEGVALPSDIAPILSLFDGTRDIREIQYDLFRSTGNLFFEEDIKTLVEKLDELFILEGGSFEKRFREVVESFSREGVRKPILSGKSYPASPDALKDFLDSIVSGVSPPSVDGEIVGIVAPHIEIRLGSSCYGLSYRALMEGEKDYELVVIFGTGHSIRGLSLCTKDFETPLGVLRVDKKLAGAVVDRLGDTVVKDEIYHKTEHSVEVQAVFIRHILGDVPILPVIAGFTLEDAPAWRVFSEVLKELTSGRRVLFVASVDLSHMGPRYGDPKPMDISSIAVMRNEDEELLSLVASLDVEGFISHFEREGGRRKICGFSPLYLLINALEGARGKLLEYGYADMDGRGSVVSFASMVFTR